MVTSYTEEGFNYRDNQTDCRELRGHEFDHQMDTLIALAHSKIAQGIMIVPPINHLKHNLIIEILLYI